MPLCFRELKDKGISSRNIPPYQNNLKTSGIIICESDWVSVAAAAEIWVCAIRVVNRNTSAALAFIAWDHCSQNTLGILEIM